MSVTLPSDEVAEDYKNALDDLVTNDRYQIANLTMIAKENIEHAEAISRVLTNHIKRAPPSRKLPALYVLDSLVKNIGSPYTVYFGRNLHETFMLAYSQVDSMIRRKLEEMLKTWREPVPGSLSNTPVFPLPSTQTIVDSLNRFRASSTPVGRGSAQAGSSIRPPHLMQGTMPYRNTPTPPQTSTPHMQPSVHVMQPTPPPQATLPHQSNFNPQLFVTDQHYASGQQANPAFPLATAQPVIRPESRTSVDVKKLHADIDDLTTDAKIECATHPMDLTAQKKLQTLQTLKEILESGTASEQDLIDIRDSIMQQIVRKFSEKRHLPPPPQPLPITSQYSQPPQHQTTYNQPNPYHNSSTPNPAFLNSTNLAELLRATSGGNSQLANYNPSHNTNFQSSTPMVNTPPTNQATPTTQGAEIPLLAQLRASGLFSATPTPTQGMTPPGGALSALLSQVNFSSEVQFSSASIKIARPQLILNFLNAKPNQCSTCGRRFTSDEIGKEKKSRHLDWHFKTKARLLEAEKRGQNRSWYVDEREWIASKEYEDDVGVAEGSESTNGLASSLATRNKDSDFVRVPSDPTLRNMPCPIDQEPFKSEWSPDIQDFIWRDAVKVGDRYYHASCYKEVTKQREKDSGRATPLSGAHRRTATPDSVLGKRKADDDEPSSASKLRVKLEQ